MKIKKMSSGFFALFLIAVLIIGIIFAGCARASDALEEAVSEEMGLARETPAESPAAEPEMDMEMSDEAVLEKSAADTTAQYGETPVSGDRKVIKTAYIEIEIETGKFDGTMFELTNLAEQSGGFVASSQSYSDSEGNLTGGYITLRVPANAYNPALNRIKEMGTVKNSSSSGQDITQEYVDLESRLRNYEAQEEVLLELMKESKKVSDSIEVQRELSNVQGEIEVIKGRMRYLDDRVSFSTIDVYFHEPDPIKTATGWGFLDALKRGLRGAVTAFNWIVMALIASAPVLIIIGIILIIVWLAIRARNRRRARKDQK